MFYEDMRIGQATSLGATRFSRAAILAYARRFDPRVLSTSATGERLAASGLHVASAAMRRLVETRGALRTTMMARGEALPELGVSPGFRHMRWPHPVVEDDVVSFSMETVSKRETSKPQWGLVGNRFRGVNQRGEEVLIFSSVVLAARRGEPRKISRRSG
jgi:acyl dehydratase